MQTDGERRKKYLKTKKILSLNAHTERVKKNRCAFVETSEKKTDKRKCTAFVTFQSP